MDGLDIPNDALQAFLAIDGDWDSDDEAAAAMHPLVVPVVVAELRRLAEREVDRFLVARLRQRAGDLENERSGDPGMSWGEMDGDR